MLQAQLEEEQTRLTHQALHDALTGLPNRVLFLERLAQSVEAASRRSIHSAVLFIDIDRFKAVNDIAGHAAGDQLLIGVARRLREVLRPADTVARLGGDEFVVLCAGVPVAYLAHGRAADILAGLGLDGPGIGARVLGYLAENRAPTP